MISLMATTMCFLASSLFYINVPVVNMRENPTNESAVVSQATFAEKIAVEKETEGWSYIATSDGYSGWVQSSACVSLPQPYEASLTVSRPLGAHLYHVKDTEFGPVKTLPYGSQLRAVDETDARWIQVLLPDSTFAYIQKGDVLPESKLMHKEELIEFSQKFLNLPYTWGGRSSFGFDCSGFVQMLYGKIGINLQRDSKQQVKDARFRLVSEKELEPGDLLFFGKSEQKIMHVGLYIGKGQFIHATARENKPWIRISQLTDFEWSGHPNAYYPYRTARQLR